MKSEDKRNQARKEAFIEVENNKLWGDEHLSGWGSTIEVTNVTREIIEKVIKEYDIKSMVDAACGDFKWMPLVLEQLSKDFKYTGCDIVPALIEKNSKAYSQYEFKVNDFVKDGVPKAELIFCRDVLQHITVSDIKDALKKFSTSGAEYLLATTHLRRYGWRNGRDIKVGKCKDRNLMYEPFNLPNPLVVFSEEYGNKFLGLWKLPFNEQ
jgi:hypothetical protein